MGVTFTWSLCGVKLAMERMHAGDAARALGIMENVQLKADEHQSDRI